VGEGVVSLSDDEVYELVVPERVRQLIAESPVLQRGQHERLLMALDRVARRAGIDPSWILEPMPEGPDREWVRGFYHHARRDLVLLGDGSTDRMASMVGGLIRNFVDARVVLVDELAQEVNEDGVPECDALFVPDFVTRRSPGTLTVRALTRALIRRSMLKKPNVLSVVDWKLVGDHYGESVSELLRDRYAVSR
jgi:hypothetical protein